MHWATAFAAALANASAIAAAAAACALAESIRATDVEIPCARRSASCPAVFASVTDSACCAIGGAEPAADARAKNALDHFGGFGGSVAGKIKPAAVSAPAIWPFLRQWARPFFRRMHRAQRSGISTPAVASAVPTDSETTNFPFPRAEPLFLAQTQS